MKLLRRFCSKQVQILLERMDNHWEEEFAIESSKWEPMLPSGNAFKHYTRVEQRCIRNTAREQTVKMKKEQAYAGILERTMSTAKTRYEFNDEKYGHSVAQGAQPAQMLTTAAIRNQMESLLNKSFDQQYAQNAAQNSYAQANYLQQHMQNVNFELKTAHSIEEMEAVMNKYKFLMGHEKQIIEHQAFLLKHAPRGYF